MKTPKLRPKYIIARGWRASNFGGNHFVCMLEFDKSKSMRRWNVKMRFKKQSSVKSVPIQPEL